MAAASTTTAAAATGGDLGDLGAHPNKAAAAAADGAAAEEPVPLLVRLLAGNSVTSITIFACLNTEDARHLRQLQPAVAGVVAAIPWCDTDAPAVVDAMRWRASLLGAVGAKLSPSAGGDWLTNEPAAAAVFGSLTHLDLQHCKFVTDDLLLRCLPSSLRVLNVRNCESLTPRASFAHLTALTTLDCSGTHIASKRVDGLPPSLQELKISKLCAVGPGVSLAHLRQLRVLRSDWSALDDATLGSLPPSLEELHALRNEGLTPAASFAHLTALRVLDVVAGSIGDASLASLPPSLVSLDARGCENLTRAAKLPHLPALRLLDVSLTDIGDALVASLPATLVELRLTACDYVTAVARLDHLRALRVLHCVDTALAPAALAACRARGCVVPAPQQLRGHDMFVNALALLDDGRLASSDGVGEVRLWDVAAGGKASAALRVGARVRALAALPGGSHIAIGTASWEGKEGCIEVWDAGGVPPVHRVTIDFRSRVWALTALPDGRLAAGCGDGEVRVVAAPVNAGSVVTTLTGHAGMATALAVLPDGKLASGSLDKTVRVWNVASRACVATLAGHASPVTSLVVLADGRLVSSESAGGVRLWDVGTRACVGALPVRTGIVRVLAAMPDGRLASGSMDAEGAIQLWDTRPAAAAGASRAAGAAPVEVVCVLGNGVAALLPLRDGRLVIAGRPSGAGTVHLLEVPPPAAVDE